MSLPRRWLRRIPVWLGGSATDGPHDNALADAAFSDVHIFRDLPPHEGLAYPETADRETWAMKLKRAFLRRWKHMQFELVDRQPPWPEQRRSWQPYEPVPPRAFLRQRIDGPRMMVTYDGTGWSARLQCTRLLVNERESDRDIVLDEHQRAALSYLGVVLTQQRDVRGAFRVVVIEQRDDDEATYWPLRLLAVNTPHRGRV